MTQHKAASPLYQNQTKFSNRLKKKFAICMFYNFSLNKLVLLSLSSFPCFLSKIYLLEITPINVFFNIPFFLATWLILDIHDISFITKAGEGLVWTGEQKKSDYQNRILKCPISEGPGSLLKQKKFLRGPTHIYWLCNSERMAEKSIVKHRPQVIPINTEIQ